MENFCLYILLEKEMVVWQGSKVFPEYVIAVQSVADRNYEPMEKIVELIF